jgi:hypothetical protein
MIDRGYSRYQSTGKEEHPTRLTPCLAQRNGRGAGRQEVGEKDDRTVDGKGIRLHSPIRNHVVLSALREVSCLDAALSRLTASRRIARHDNPRPPDYPDCHCTAPLLPHACFGLTLRFGNAADLER